MKSPPKTGTEGAGHPDPVTERETGIGEYAAEFLLDVVMFRIVLFTVQLLESGLIPLVEKEEFALGQHLADYLIDQLSPECEGDRFFGHSAKGLLAELVKAHVERHEDVVFRGEVVVDRRLGHSEPLSDLSQ